MRIIANQLNLRMNIEDINSFDTLSLYQGEIVNKQQLQGINQFWCPKDTQLMNVLNNIGGNLDLSRYI